MDTVNSAVETLIQSSNTLFILLGAIMVFAMHAGFAFLEVGTVRHKNQVNALVKIMTDFGFSALVYFFVGYWVAYDVTFFSDAATLAQNNGYTLVKFFFLMTFAAAIPAIISGGVAERARFWPMLAASALTVGLVYPFFEGIIWNGNYGFQAWLESSFGAQFHDFAGSVVVHGVGGWIALVAVLLLGNRDGRYRGDRLIAYPPSSIPFLALGAWILCIGWFGFNVMSAQTLDGISGLVAVNSLMAMVGGIVVALVLGRNDPGFIHNGPLAGLVAVCAGSDLLHPMGALAVGGVAAAIFVWLFTLMQNRWKIDDVLGVWPLHGVCGAWGGIAAGIFGSEALGGLGGVSLLSQLVGTLAGIAVALVGGALVYGGVKLVAGLRLSQEQEFNGADLSIHRIESTSLD
ncbi:ammonium transporter [Marinobacterium rhizophilum]|uniref:Ammonium transporter n=1 Tax=Marinobacterium rhizophilum TaxID=420402 RepID=A0ABY5HPP8_9GAMM|nr:ammonium transporter [Marinobacterium rhizophilum]UTW13762.1 ammonium transporter [Marinobacterium rhizophilum]